ncbi:LPXTG cell wall anchor domain-containing protein [Staphylococcus pseudintermedius]|nr:LPXTG cell wall anchor domain-containing protein [Staphylococcus pseudintermedius]
MKKTISVLGLGLLATFFVSNESYAAETIQNNTSSSETNQNSDQTPLDHYIRKADGTLVEPNVYPHKDYVENEGPLPEFKFMYADKQNHHDQQSKNNKDKQRANYSDKKHNDQPGHPKAVTSNATVKALPNTGESDKTTQLPIVLSLLSVGILVLLKLRK